MSNVNTTNATLKRTPLYDEHRELKGRLIDFGGWELPVQYTGLMDEHTACRTTGGLFDVSHMGEFFVEGKDAERFLNESFTNDVRKLRIHQAHYSVLCYPDGGIVDDLLVYKRADEKYLVVVNAGNIEKDFDYLKSLHQQGDYECTLENKSSEWAQIAIQGRISEKVLQKFSSVNLSEIPYYCFREGTFLGNITVIFSRTGYTGEDGFEVYCKSKEGPRVWRALLEEGAPLGLKPCGLGARDTLRLEVRFPLYGHELTKDTNPLEAGLGWVVKLDKEKFVGKEALVKVKADGLKRKLVGLKLLTPGIARQDYKIFSKKNDTEIGFVTSGTQSPSLKYSIALGYVPLSEAEIGNRVTVEVRNQKIECEIIPTPFYKRDY
jgi:aminomethyltransferase